MPVDNTEEPVVTKTGQTAVTVLAVLFSLLLLAVILTAVYCKRELLLGLLPRRSDREQRSGEQDRESSRAKQGLFNLQSVTIQTAGGAGRAGGRPAVGGSSGPSLERQITTELEQRLEGRRAEPRRSGPPRKAAAPTPPRDRSAGIKAADTTSISTVAEGLSTLFLLFLP